MDDIAHAADRRPVADRIAALDTHALARDLDAEGHAILPALLAPAECDALAAAYDDDAHFRSRVVMARHGFGRGEYRYFDYPLPPVVHALRTSLYPPLAAIANRWHEQLREPSRFPPTHAAFLARCRDAGQSRATPLLLRYGPGDYNCLHQDLYGERVFPLQVAVLLSQPERDFTGGEFVLTEKRPRRQSRASVAPLRQGDAVVFAVSARPAVGARGAHRVVMRHGVATVRSGSRHTLGVIFHDAR